MSRIAGIISKNPININMIASKMKDGIISDSSWKSEVIRVGELSAFIWAGWRTPEISKYGSIVISMDGYIYNKKEIDLMLGIRDECSDVYRFNKLYSKFGFENSLLKINGDFSISLFNETTGELFLARDRFGIKPLYYTNLSSHFAYASRPRGIFQVPKVSREINKRFAAVFGGAHYRYIDNFSNESPYQQINQLPASHYLRIKNNKKNTLRKKSN